MVLSPIRTTRTVVYSTYVALLVLYVLACRSSSSMRGRDRGGGVLRPDGNLLGLRGGLREARKSSDAGRFLERKCCHGKSQRFIDQDP